MIDVAMNWLMGFDLTSRMGILLYWLPLALCAYGFTERTFTHYRKCCERRDKGEFFESDTVGTLIGRAIVTVLPVTNLLQAVFDLAPRIFGRFFKMLGQVFNTPLVAKPKK
jgi:hypothetical protein